MGEKLRDLCEIDLAGGRLLVELNEGSGGKERHIHLQTPKFRYLFREREFLILLSKTIRAEAELQYMKSGSAAEHE